MIFDCPFMFFFMVCFFSYSMIHHYFWLTKFRLYGIFSSYFILFQATRFLWGARKSTRKRGCARPNARPWRRWRVARQPVSQTLSKYLPILLTLESRYSLVTLNFHSKIWYLRRSWPELSIGETCIAIAFLVWEIWTFKSVFVYNEKFVLVTWKIKT